MSASYEGTIFNGGDSHKIKNLHSRLNALTVAYESLQRENETLKAAAIIAPVETTMLPKQTTTTRPKSAKKRIRRTPQQMAAARAKKGE